MYTCSAADFLRKRIRRNDVNNSNDLDSLTGRDGQFTNLLSSEILLRAFGNGRRWFQIWAAVKKAACPECKIKRFR